MCGMRLTKSLKQPLPGRFKGWILPAVVFLTGACVLVIEVVATRILAPYFGNTIFSYSSILGVVLAALSIGYYYGGRLADSRPDARLFYGIIAAGGVAVMLLHILTITLLPILSRQLSITTGPLVSSVVLFLLPAILLGMLSPFAIKLQQAFVPQKGIGSIAGEMFFWSTLGSIAGSLITGFVLVPFFGVDHIILGVGVVLIALGVLPLIALTGKRFRALGVLAILVSIVFAMQVPVMADVITKQDGLVYSKDGLYEKLSIYDGEYQGRPARFFQQDRSNSGAMYLDSDELVYDYTKYYSLYKLFKPDVREALVIGGGVYSVPKVLLSELPEANIDVSEIEPSLHDLSKQYFNVPDTPRLSSYTDDGRRLLDKGGKQYDYIFSDVYYSLYSIPSHFTTEEFFELARQRLNQDGVFIANLIGNLDRREPSFILSEMRTFQQAFPNSYFFATGSPNSTATQNIMFVGVNGDKRLDLNAAEITGHSDPTIAGLASKHIDPQRFDLTRYPVLTDNYAPVEYLITPLLGATNSSTANGNTMMELIRQQLSYGGRHAGGAGHGKVRDFIAAEARASTQHVTMQQWQERDRNGKAYSLANVVARLQPDNPRRIIVGTHFDTKAYADKDPLDGQAPVPGANDGASGVAVLLEAARVLAADKLPVGIDFVFFDGEEGLPDTGTDSGEWQPLGSQFFTSNLDTLYPNGKPEGGIVIDMVCDRNLGIAQDAASLRFAPGQTNRFWEIGKRLAPNAFLPADGREITDDHTALNQAGIPSFVVTDFDYPPFHTTADTLDKCSPASLSTVGRTLVQYIRELK